jgi:hypothetical protein
MGKARYTKNEVYFHEPTIKSTYMAGVIAADGYIGIDNRQLGNIIPNRLSLKLTDTDSKVIDYMRDELEYTGPIFYKHPAPTNYTTKTNPSDIRVSYGRLQRALDIRNAARLVSDLQLHYNIGQNKSLTLSAPNIKAADFVLAYILGYYYGDGSYSVSKTNRPKISFVVSPPFADWLLPTLTSLFGRTWTVYKRATSFELSTANKKVIQNFLDTMRTLPVPEEWKPLRKLYEDKYWEYRLATEAAKKLRDAKLQNT